MTTPEEASNPSQPTLPLEELVEWFNAQAATVDSRAAVLRDPDLTPTPQTVAGAAALVGELGEVAGQQSLLKDLKGFLIGRTAAAAGQLDFVPESFIEPNEDPPQT